MAKHEGKQDFLDEHLTDLDIQSRTELLDQISNLAEVMDSMASATLKVHSQLERIALLLDKLAKPRK